MAVGTTHLARIGALTLLAGAVLAAGGCSLPANTGATPTGNGQLGSTPTVAPTSASPTVAPTTAAAPTTPALTFPADAKAYALKLITAWATKDDPTLKQLADPTTLTKINGYGHINVGWTYITCEGAAGSSYCRFSNASGDELIIRLVNQFLGGPHAVNDATLDKISFPNDPVAYVTAFVTAWQHGNTSRMLAYSNSTVKNIITHYTPPDTFLTCTGDSSSGHQHIRVYNTDGLDYTFTVASPMLGQAHAIEEAELVSAVCI